MRIVGLVEAEDHVCTRYRLAAFQPSLQEAGIELRLQPLPRRAFARFRLYRSLKSADLVILQRRLLSLAELAVLRRYARKLAFDFDDAVWLRDSYSRRGFHSLKRRIRFRSLIARCDLVLAGNNYLAEKASQYIKFGEVRVVPTCVDVGQYPTARQCDARVVRLVWVGSTSTLQGLKKFSPVLEAIGQAVPEVRLKLICDSFFQLRSMPVEEVQWRQETEADEIADAEVGIGWVPDDPWSRGKCGLKVLQYQAAGLPVVANAVGVQQQFVKPDVTGYLAETAEEWVEAIRKLAGDAELRQRLGQAARRQVQDSYSVERGAELWLAALNRFGGDANA